MNLYKLFISACLLSSSLVFPLSSDLQNTKPSELVEEKFKCIIGSIKDLQKQGLLDGEILIAQGNLPLLHLRSQDIEGIEEPQFMIGSVSKQFFAVALLKALYDSCLGETEDAKINEIRAKIYAPISLFLPKNAAIWAGNMPVWAHEVSLHQLLTHTSGIPNHTEFEEFLAYTTPDRKYFEFPHSPAEIIQIVSAKPLLFPPGSKFSYSNTNYLLVAEIIETITKKTASSYLQEALFDPIGLVSTTNLEQGRLDELQSFRLPSQWNYDPRGDQETLYPQLHMEDISIAKGAGSIVSSATDLLKWNQALHKTRSVLPDSLYSMFLQEYLDGYGYGIGIDPSDLGKILGHSGGIGGFRTLLCYFPDHDLSVIVLSNISYDYDKIDGEYKELFIALQETIPDERERAHEALKILSEKYPGKRGFEKILSMMQTLPH